MPLVATTHHDLVTERNIGPHRFHYGHPAISIAHTVCEHPCSLIAVIQALPTAPVSAARTREPALPRIPSAWIIGVAHCNGLKQLSTERQTRKFPFRPLRWVLYLQHKQHGPESEECIGPLHARATRVSSHDPVSLSPMIASNVVTPSLRESDSGKGSAVLSMTSCC